MQRSTDEIAVNEVNRIGAEIAKLCEGSSENVVLNVAVLMLAGVVRTSRYTLDQAHEALDFAFDSGAGFTGTVVLRS